MEWWQTLLVALGTYGFTKFVDQLLTVWKDKRDFKLKRRDDTFAQIEDLKDQLGRMYELAINSKTYDYSTHYLHHPDNQFSLIGKWNKYPEIADAAREVVYWCTVVRKIERDPDNQRKNEAELRERYQTFLQVCKKFIDGLV